MQKYLCWYLIFLKHEIKKVTTWILFVLIALMSYFVHKVAMPSNNTKIILVNEDGALADQLVKTLVHSKSNFSFQQIDTVEELKDIVIKGQADCGFVFRSGFEDSVRRVKQEQFVTCFISTFTSKASVARETVYAKFYQIYSDYILTDLEKQLFPTVDPIRSELLLQKNHEFLVSDEVLGVNVQSYGNNTNFEDKKSTIVPLRGSVGLILFMAVFIARSENIGEGRETVFKYRPKRVKDKILFIKYLAALTLPTVFSAIVLGMYSGKWFLEVIFLVLYSFLCLVQGIFFGKIFRREDTYCSYCVSMLFLHIILCPIFIDISKFFPAVRLIKWIFPLTIYLYLSNLIF